jgi:von Willebrand factor type A domain
MNTEIDNDFPFMNPSMRCQPLITQSTIQYHHEPYENTDSYFGILTINMRGEVPATSKKQHFIFSIDCSGSMSDICNDSRTKMQHILHTVVNILRIFANTYEGQMTVTINAFDDSVKNIISNTVVTKENINELLKLVNDIYPMGLTNIGDVLNDVYTNVLQIDKKEYDITHILLTDGQITSGIFDPNDMKIPDCKNIYIGYGSNHDSYLLTNLASKNQTDEYKFIDALEKAGFVYGELLQNLLYKSYDQVTIEVENCEIYDYNTNMWSNKLFVGDLVSEQKKIYHVRSLQPSVSLVHIIGRKLHKTRMFEVLPDEPEHIYDSRYVRLFNSLLTDLTQYIYRQKAQELLYEARQRQNLNADIVNIVADVAAAVEEQREATNTMKQKLKDLFDTIQKYMDEKGQQTNKLLKTICDDLYIAYETYGHHDGFMFTVARQISQGRQETYSCNRIETVDVMYQVSDNIDTPYLTQGVLEMMREVSATPNLY